MPLELTEIEYDIIEKLSEEGNQLFEAQKWDAALKKYQGALNIVPSPKTNWEASTWLYTSIGDVYFLQEAYDDARENYYNALNCPEGLGNAYINLCLGQALFVLEEHKKSQEFLLRAYMLEGEELFIDEDPKYFASIQNVIAPNTKYIYKGGSRYYKDEDGNLIEDN